jgi:hypothetical protein
MIDTCHRRITTTKFLPTLNIRVLYLNKTATCPLKLRGPYSTTTTTTILIRFNNPMIYDYINT